MRRRAFDWENEFSEEKRDRKEQIRHEQVESEAQEKESKLLKAVNGFKAALTKYLSLGGIDSELFESVDKRKAAIRDEIMAGYMAGGEDADGSKLRKALHAASAAYKLVGYLSNIRIDDGVLREVGEKLSNGDFDGIKRKIAEISKNIAGGAKYIDAAIDLTGKGRVNKWVNDVSMFLPDAETVGEVFSEINEELVIEKLWREKLLGSMRELSALL